jgi:triosephosphate isomerase
MINKKEKDILVGAAWKMNKDLGQSIEYAKKLNSYCLENITEDDNVKVFFLPTFLPLYHMKDIISAPSLDYGAQNCCWEDEGSFTGEVSPAHLKDAGCTYVELGHAERRRLFGEDDAMLNLKVLAALRNGLKPILCIGEKERENDMKAAFSFLKNQLLTGLKSVKADQQENIIIAYEPVWAIGAPESAPISYTEEILDFLRDLLKSHYGSEASLRQMIFYGGAVNPDTAPAILEMEQNDGIFIGRASLDLKYLIQMVEMALEYSRSRK